jgi:hypothetical protein
MKMIIDLKNKMELIVAFYLIYLIALFFKKEEIKAISIIIIKF